MDTKKRNINWIIRIIIFILFILSGVSKMFPIWAFEKQLVDLHFVNWCQAPYLSRFVVALEMAIGIAILQKHHLKRLVIPITILLLVAFCIHLSIQMVQFGPMNGNCGCFGQLIPMTPLEAFIKNVLTIALLIYLYKNITENENNKIIYPVVIFVCSLIAMFIAFKVPPCSMQETAPLPVFIPQDTMQLKDAPPALETKTIEEVKPQQTTPGVTQQATPKEEVTAAKPVKKVVASAHSKFANYTVFGDKKVNLDEGKKIVCLFAAGCDHCRATAKAICKLSQETALPEVYILFMDEETFLINEFFKEAQCTYPYQVVNIPEFWNVLGVGKNTPGVFLLNNGNIVTSYEGITENKFDPEAFKKSVIETK